MIAFSHDGKALAAAQPDGWVRLWDREGSEPTERATFPAHKVRVIGVLAFRPDGRTLISGGGTTGPDLEPHGWHAPKRSSSRRDRSAA